MTLYQYLQYEGIQRELSLRQIAIRSGLSVQSIYLLKKRRPNYTTYNKLAQFLKVVYLSYISTQLLMIDIKKRPVRKHRSHLKLL